MKTGIALVLCFIFLIFGSVALGQQEVSNGTREYVGEVASFDMTPEELSEMEGDFYYNPATTNQYSPNIERQRITYIRELILEGIIPAPGTPVLGINIPTTPMAGFDAGDSTSGASGKPAAPTGPSAPQSPAKVKF